MRNRAQLHWRALFLRDVFGGVFWNDEGMRDLMSRCADVLAAAPSTPIEAAAREAYP